MTIEEMIKKCRVCVILRNLPMEIFPEYVKSVYQGGARMFEVAMNSDNSEEQIAYLKNEFGDRAYVGAGTVITKERAKKAQKAGAQFFLSPSSDKEVLDFCGERKIPFLPGVMTPTDISFCLSYGYKVMKLFPFRSLSENYIKDLSGPFEEAKFVAVGGVGADNVINVFNQGYIGVGIGTNLVPLECFSEKDWKQCENRVHDLICKIDAFLTAKYGVQE